MRNIQINYRLGAESLPDSSPLLIAGNIRHLHSLKYDNIKFKLQPFVTKETYEAALCGLCPNPSDNCSLYLNIISIAAFADKATHYNSSAQPHLLTEIVKSFAKGKRSNLLIVCEMKDVYASGCAVAKAFPLFSRKTNDNSRQISQEKVQILVEFLILQDNEVINVSNSEIIPLNYNELQTITETLSHVAFGIQLAAKIVDMPCSEMNVDDFIEEIKNVGKMLNIVPDIIRGEELKERGFGGIYGVGRGASIPPALVILSHRTSNATEDIAWVGKGIVYDTGGLCIKGRTAMPGMKRDCGGAAAVLGAFYAAVKCGFTQNLHAVLCLAENAVGPLATKPDDIHRLYSGKTVEINNTDAEGRLVLADGVVYAKIDLKATTIVDVATLTGAQPVSTGKHHAAVMSNHRKWEQLAVDSGLESGDLAFPIIYCPELYFNEYSSEVADMKNSVADRTNALSSCAGLFMAAHLGFDPDINWIHFDIAGVSYLGERATGYGVALLNVMFGKYSKHTGLQYLCPSKSNITNCDSHLNKKRKT